MCGGFLLVLGVGLSGLDEEYKSRVVVKIRYKL